MLTLYGYFRSSASFRVRIALNLKGLSYASEIIWLPDGEHQGPAYRGTNPSGLVPALDDAGSVLSQSLAIIEYLDETRPIPPLLPGDPLARAWVRMLAQIVACDIHPVNNLRVLKYLKTDLAQPQSEVDQWYRHWCAEGLSMVERELQRAGAEGRYCYGDTPGLADCALVPQIFNAKRFDVDLAPYPTVMRIFDQCMRLPAFDQAQPAKQPDAARAQG